MLNLNKELKFNISKCIDLNTNSFLLLKTNNILDINDDLKKNQIFINLKIINHIRRINKFHELVNDKLSINNFYIICAETLEERRQRVWNKTPFGFKHLFKIIDFIYKRVFPKLPIFKKIYFLLSGGNNRVLSKAEILGRLISCGFEIIKYFEYNNLFYVVTKKCKAPDYNLSPSYGPIFKMKRVGYKKKYINVYKLRTMYPYSEYLQELIIKENKLKNSGKVSNDYRITTWGLFCRKFWIDELPMIINFLKGDLNLVGVRPLSIGYYNRYPKELKDLRIKVKPGLIPPYYVDLPENFNEILESERKYILLKLKNPILTDIKYFYRAFINIFFKGVRSG